LSSLAYKRDTICYRISVRPSVTLGSPLSNIIDLIITTRRHRHHCIVERFRQLYLTALPVVFWHKTKFQNGARCRCGM